MGEFNPKEHTAEQRGYDAKGNYVRGLKMPPSRFENMVHGHSSDEQKSMRQQVNEAEARGLRKYYVKHSRGYYTVENGIVIGTPKMLVPIARTSDLKNFFLQEYGDFPLYGFFLFSTMDEDIIQFLIQHASWLHNISGEDILLAVFENPEKWGARWKDYWQLKLGPRFDEKYAEWSTILESDRDLSYSIADLMGVGKNNIPCIVFAKSLKEKQILCIPLTQNKDNYRDYFEDIFTVIQDVKKIPTEDQFTVFQKKWKSVWVKWILPEKIKKYNNVIQDWGSEILETKTTIMSIVEPITPFIAPIKAAISK
jgi:hypothetical protein